MDQLLDIKLQTPLRVYSADNRLIAEFGEKRRTPVTIEQIPTIQLQAFLAAEDAGFYDHMGVDFKGLLRAAVELATTGSIQSGGSTITMQVAKNYFLTRDRTFLRKFNEILLAIQIERELEKNTILELYLNKIYLGKRAYGIQAAAQVYYNKNVDELNLAQMAMLAGLPKAPSAYNPLANPRRAMIRRNWILGRMRDLHMISPDDYERAVNAPLTAKYNAPASEVDADYVAEMARMEMVSRFGEAAYTDGFDVILTVRGDRQQAATTALRDGIANYDSRHGYRGPIGTIDLAGDLSAADIVGELRNYPRIESLYPAAVTAIDDEAGTVTLLARRLGPAVLAMEDLVWARPYRSVNATGPEPKRPSDVLSAGDVVYVTPKQQRDDRPVHDEAEGEPATPRDAAQPPVAVALSQLPEVQGALISLNAQTGAIEALTGGYSFSQSNYNRATQANRQPGSTFKPFLYLAALEQGMTPATIYNDAPIVFDDPNLESTWRPQNSSGQFYGPTRLREALTRSRNLVSIRLLRDVGIQHTLDYLDQLGIPTANMQKDLSLALGSGLLTPMELARGFAVIANGGYDVQPYLISAIYDSSGKEVYRAPTVELCDDQCEHKQEAAELTEDGAPAVRYAPRLADARSVYILHSILRDVVRRGTGRRALALGRDDIGGKTGTTNQQRDTWFAGFNHHMATTVWLGFDQPAPLGRREYGASTALPPWLEYMKVALADEPAAFMPQPNGIVSVRIDPNTGHRARPGQDGALFELFREEQAPAPLEPDFNAIGSESPQSLPQNIF
nr:penicillin-binding protein 1A [Marinobacter sp. X15-166B]